MKMLFALTVPLTSALSLKRARGTQSRCANSVLSKQKEAA